MNVEAERLRNEDSHPTLTWTKRSFEPLGKRIGRLNIPHNCHAYHCSMDRGRN